MPAYTQQQYSALKALIDSEPANVGRSDPQIQTWGDETAVAAAVSAGDIMSVVLRTGEYGAIEAAADNSGHPANVAARNARALLANRDRQIDYADAAELQALQAATQALVDGGLIGTTTKAAVDGLGLNRRTRWAGADLPRPTLHQIAVARAS